MISKINSLPGDLMATLGYKAGMETLANIENIELVD